jgi:hypothetical protein
VDGGIAWDFQFVAKELEPMPVLGGVVVGRLQVRKRHRVRNSNLCCYITLGCYVSNRSRQEVTWRVKLNDFQGKRALKIG